ncbi:MAG: RnfABCDGE type electron transport complex subunit B [Thermodesulfobacteriota bacterium]
MLTPILVLTGLGFAAAALLAVASRLLYVKEDPRIAQVEGVLPGANCGGCGYAGCSGAAAAVVAGKAGTGVCIVGGDETAAEVAAIMGMAVEVRESQCATRDCTGGVRAEKDYHYEGATNCQAMHLFYSGSTTCQQGCLGLGSCVQACPFDAIRMGPNGLPVIDPDTCKACGKCVEACPRNVIAIHGMSSRLLHLNETTDCLAPCRQKCPGQINIQRYIEQITQGDYAGAIETIRERNPFLLACGRVCPRPCETQCRRQHVDESVGINMLKRFVADWEYNQGVHLPIACAPETGRKVAIIGGGPAGLSCAFFLRRLGHSPTIFEAMPALGGQMRYGIPEYRLPKAILDWEIQGILDLGVEARLNTRLGVDFTVESLREEGFEAFFMGIGAWQCNPMGVPGEDMPGVMDGIAFLTTHMLGKGEDLKGKKVIVVGGGNTAIDAARTSIRLGADVTIMYRRTKKEMPANPEEIVGAEEENVKFLFLAAPTKVVAGEDGRASHIEYVTMALGEPDASGRRRPVAVQGSETLLEADLIIPAIGQKPDTACLYEPDSNACTLDLTRWQTITADPDTLQTAVPDVFTGGDVFTGPDLVISAIGAGRKAARSIHYHLTQGVIPIPANLQREMIPLTLFKMVDRVVPIQRAHMPHLCHGDDRNCTFNEVEGALTEDEALVEAGRCLRCGLICYDQNPDVPLDLVARHAE